MRTIYFLVLSFFVFALPAWAHTPVKPSTGCKSRLFEAVRFVVCTFDVRRDDIRLFHTKPDGGVHGQFASLDQFLAQRGQKLRFAMNAGMYHADRTPVGLYVENGKTVTPLNRQSGVGNFFLKPNGVFYVHKGQAAVLDARRFAKKLPRRAPDFATQSGPMLVINGKLHSAFLPAGSSKFIRNGVGVMADLRTVHFVISETPVNFHTFGRFFRDSLSTPNALYLDGTVSKLYAPSIQRDDRGRPMGPIVGVVEPVLSRKKTAN